MLKERQSVYTALIASDFEWNKQEVLNLIHEVRGLCGKRRVYAERRWNAYKTYITGGERAIRKRDGRERPSQKRCGDFAGD